MSLSAEQLETFRRDGVLILKNVFDPADVRAWREEALAFFDHPGSGEDWRAALRRVRADDFKIADDPTPMAHAPLASLYRSLHSTADWDGENELLVRPGPEDSEWLGARAPHLDYPVAVPMKTMANSIFYLTDVETRGGAFMYWPGSHHIAWDHHRAHPADYLSCGERSQDQTFQLLTARMPNAPVEFIAEAGDLLIWHAFILHSASINMRARTRLAIIGRWGVERQTKTPWDFQSDIWADWSFSPRPDRQGDRHAPSIPVAPSTPVERRLETGV